MSWFLPFFCLVDLLPKMTSLGLKKKYHNWRGFCRFFLYNKLSIGSPIGTTYIDLTSFGGFLNLFRSPSSDSSKCSIMWGCKLAKFRSTAISMVQLLSTRWPRFQKQHCTRLS